MCWPNLNQFVFVNVSDQNLISIPRLVLILSKVCCCFFHSGSRKNKFNFSERIQCATEMVIFYG